MEQKETVVHSFDGKTVPEKTEKTSQLSSTNIMTIKTIAIFAAVILLGALTGFLIVKMKPGAVPVTSGTNVASLPKGTVFGSDAKNFKDSAEGILRKGGVGGEGAYHLERPGGDSQSVYLTSSVLDLSQLEGRKIKVWGETNAAQKAGWLMDVGRAQVVN